MAPTVSREAACFCGPARWGMVCCGVYTKRWDNPHNGKPHNAKWDWRARSEKPDPTLQPTPVETERAAEEGVWHVA